MRQHDALRLARRSRRIDQRRQVVRLHREGVLAVEVPPRFVVHGGAPPLHVGERLVGAVVARFGEGDHVPQPGALAAHLRDLRRLHGVADEDRHRAGVVQNVGGLLGGQVRVQRHVGERCRETRVIRERPLRPVLREDRHAVSRLDPQLLQTERDPAHALTDRATRDRRVRPLDLDLQRVGLVVRQRTEEQPCQGAGRGVARSTGCDHRCLRRWDAAGARREVPIISRRER